MARAVGAEEFVPDSRRIDRLRKAAADCRGCDLYRHADRVVFGEGPVSARLLLVGEQPGDREDRAGHPFVGPAGRILDEALEQAGVARSQVYLTNVVKHFKFTRPEGRRRLHKTPGRTEIVACLPWLAAELAAVKPRVVVCLGATAAKALLGNRFRVTRRRGELLDPAADPDVTVDERVADLLPRVLATMHPSAVLRGRPEERAAAVADLADDLSAAHRAA
ncbi:DNA polymerase [Stackebrandtia albiflava]|uniref:Type-4 uracil-DNA glycosylase n=1 Tax=Stackebrandtia albiflava TaxID=406432 RepID=A0A562V386_9ACTN|nr:UdgX family uracil-DNA binding protein [Stackebrandtia albiflava]TWJ12318.1 DNA polymerase [Stackebrandtia albiflava]